MSIVETSLGEIQTRFSQTPGPVTRRYLKRTLTIYISCVMLGLLPFLAGMSPGWQAAGLGLWMPGAGFVAVGGWASLLLPVSIVLFAASLVAWFWAGVVIAPVTVWIGSALLAGGMATDEVNFSSHFLVGLMLGGITWFVRSKTAERRAKDEKKAAVRQTFIQQSLAEVREQSRVNPDETTREMTESQLESLRYLLDRSLQPIDQFNGFDVIDQFQPAALRYQINHMGFALGIAQGAYLPNFRGYMRTAQQNLIEKYLLRKVWGYWVYESCWGHLNFTDFDPAKKDNIMLTGWFGSHVSQYMLNSGDRRYGETGSLTFSLNDKTQYVHDLHSIIGSVVSNYNNYEEDFCLYPCEPNWMYPICNHYGMTSLASYDRLYGTGYSKKLLPVWLEKQDTEFTDRSGSIIGLRSQLTGIELPFPVKEYGYATFANCFAPDRAQRLWAVGRKELEPLLEADEGGEPILTFSGKGLDAGNYKSGHLGNYSSVLSAAKEFGDEHMIAAAERGLEKYCSPHREGGVLSYLGGSNISNSTAAMGKLMGTGDFRRSFVEGPSDSVLRGPCLGEAKYPDVLVARAYSNGTNLSLTLYPGCDIGPQTLGLEQLTPDKTYRVTGATVPTVIADGDCRSSLTVNLSGRTEVSLERIDE